MKILFIITSSIAAIKCRNILKLLKNKKIYVDCIVTENVKKIINYNDLEDVIDGNIYSDKSEKKNKMLHITLTRKCDLIVLCPATANTIAKYSKGYCDNLASTALLASNKQTVIIPAMNSQMWNNSINQQNIKKLIDIGVEFIGPVYGKLSCGETGLGRLADLNTIIEQIILRLKKSNIFKGKKCIVTAGPTIEKIDPIRYITNYSSGKQGYEIANQLALCGANVILISGPTYLQKPYNVKLIITKTADQMFGAVKKIKNVDIGIFAAAVSDFKPEKTSKNKIKKNKIKQINLKQNIDILKNIGFLKKNRPKILIGFAAETANVFSAKKKLIEKNCDLMIYNKINKYNSVFNSDYNKINILYKNNIKKFPRMSKANCAKEIINQINNIFY